MISARHAVAAIALPFVLGAVALSAGNFAAFAIALFLLLAAVGVEVALWEVRSRREQVERSRVARRAAGPLLSRNCAYDPDAYFDQVTRRWAG